MAYIDVFQSNRTSSIQYIEPFQYKTTSHIQELDHTPPYKDTIIYKKPAFKCQQYCSIMSNIRKPVILLNTYLPKVCI